MGVKKTYRSEELKVIGTKGFDEGAAEWTEARLPLASSRAGAIFTTPSGVAPGGTLFDAPLVDTPPSGRGNPLYSCSLNYRQDECNRSLP